MHTIARMSKIEQGWNDTTIFLLLDWVPDLENHVQQLRTVTRNAWIRERNVSFFSVRVYFWKSLETKVLHHTRPTVKFKVHGCVGSHHSFVGHSVLVGNTLFLLVISFRPGVLVVRTFWT